MGGFFLGVFFVVVVLFWFLFVFLEGGLVYNALHNQPSISASFIRQSIKSITQTGSKTNT